MIIKHIKILAAVIVLAGLFPACNTVNVPYKKKRGKCDCSHWSYHKQNEQATSIYEERS